MKERHFSLVVLVTLVMGMGTVIGATPDQEFVKAHERMYTNDMTQYSDIAAYRPDDYVTREQAAKFFVAFDREVMGRAAETEMYCLYSDEELFDTTLA